MDEPKAGEKEVGEMRIKMTSFFVVFVAELVMQNHAQTLLLYPPQDKVEEEEGEI